MPRFDPMPRSFAAKCVETVSDSGPTAMDPIPFSVPADEAFTVVKQTVQEQPRTSITDEQDGCYLDSIFRTKLLRFKDRVQFEVDEDAGVIHFQSYSTPTFAGSDLGANRKRMQSLVAEIAPKVR